MTAEAGASEPTFVQKSGLESLFLFLGLGFKSRLLSVRLGLEVCFCIEVPAEEA